MARPRQAIWGLPIAAVAAAGVVLGHWLGYLWAVPQDRFRVETLAETGHAYWHTAVQAAVVLSVVALGTVLVRHLGSRHGIEGPLSGPAPIAVRMASIQIVTFVAMEVAERLVAGVPVSTLLSHHVLPIGVLAQILVAGAAALILHWFNRAAGRLSDRLGMPTVLVVPGAVFVRPRDASWHRRPILAGAAGVRGPPTS